jgi:hypothetical protein
MNKFRFRNHISTLPQPNFGDSATKIRHASATKKRRFRNQKKDDSATKKKTIPQPKKKIPQPKKENFATKKKQFRNHHPRDSEGAHASCDQKCAAQLLRGHQRVLVRLGSLQNWIVSTT